MILHTKELLAADLFAYKGPNASLTDGNVTEFINKAQEMAGRRLYLYSGLLTMTRTDNVSVYPFDTAFSRPMLDVQRVRVTTAAGTTILRGHTQKYGLWTQEQYEAKYPGYEANTKGTPDAAWAKGEALVFNKPVNATTVTAVTVAGRHLPLPLSSGSDVSEINADLHRYVCYLAAFIAAEPVATTDEAWSRLKSYRESAAVDFEAEARRQYALVHGREMPASG